MTNPAAFLAHVIVVGKANLSADDQERLQRLAAQWLKVGDRVEQTSATLPQFAGVIAEFVDDTHARVTLDAPTEMPQDGATVLVTEITVPLDRLATATDPPA